QRLADQEPLRYELRGDVARPRELLRLVSAEAAPGAVAARAERLRERPGRADQHVGVAPHVSWNQHGLPDVPELGRQLGVPRREGAGRTLAVHAQAGAGSAHLVGLVFRDV